MLQELLALARGIGQTIFPSSCLVCDAPQADDCSFRHGLCTDCSQSIITRQHAACKRCALAIGPYSETEGGCSGCRERSLGFDSAHSLGEYQGRLREAVLRMKAGSGESLSEMMGRVLAEELGEALRRDRIDVVVPVPLHWRRVWTRGYNQAAAAARELAAGLNLRCESRALVRIRHTPQQVHSSAAARRENVRGAFWARRPASLAGKRILLVDDVMTTGSTAGEAARTLKGAGATAVIVAVLARR